MRRARFLVSLAIFLAGMGSVPAGAANDPYIPRQWGLATIGAPDAWTVATGAGVTIGVVDTGVQLDHEDLAGRLIGSTTCVGTSGRPAACSGTGGDIDGHGTHVAGIAAATANDGKGGAGAAPGARLLAANVFTHDSSGKLTANVSDINAGVEWVVDHGAKVVNLSVGEYNSVLVDAFGTGLSTGIEYAYNHGAIAVVAAGNSAGAVGGPGSSSGYGNVDALVVTATNQSDAKASYASPPGSAKWGLAAPGGDVTKDGKADCAGTPTDGCILSTYTGNRYAWLEGTSQAAPFVSGAVAVLLSHGLSRDAAVNQILATLAPASCGQGCRGRLDLARAVGAPRGAGATVTSTNRTTKPPTRAPAVATTATSEASTTSLPPTTVLAPAVGSPAPPKIALDIGPGRAGRSSSSTGLGRALLSGVALVCLLLVIAGTRRAWTGARALPPA